MVLTALSFVVTGLIQLAVNQSTLGHVPNDPACDTGEYGKHEGPCRMRTTRADAPRCGGHGLTPRAPSVHRLAPHNGVHRCCIDNCVSVFAQVAPYFLLTSGEIMLSVTGLVFGRAPPPPRPAAPMRPSSLRRTNADMVVLRAMACEWRGQRTRKRRHP